MDYVSYVNGFQMIKSQNLRHFSVPSSRTATELPALAILLAATPPPYPDPITTTSYSGLIIGTGLLNLGNFRVFELVLDDALWRDIPPTLVFHSALAEERRSWGIVT